MLKLNFRYREDEHELLDSCPFDNKVKICSMFCTGECEYFGGYSYTDEAIYCKRDVH